MKTAPSTTRWFVVFCPLAGSATKILKLSTLCFANKNIGVLQCVTHIVARPPMTAAEFHERHRWKTVTKTDLFLMSLKKKSSSSTILCFLPFERACQEGKGFGCRAHVGYRGWIISLRSGQSVKRFLGTSSESTSTICSVLVGEIVPCRVRCLKATHRGRVWRNGRGRTGGTPPSRYVFLSSRPSSSGAGLQSLTRERISAVLLRMYVP